MRITKESSGGRGEYEWCDLQPLRDPSAGELLDRRIILQLPDGYRIDTGSILGSQGGKQRIRLASDMKGKKDLYPIWHVAALLLMPRPSRDEQAWDRGVPVMRSEQYGIRDLFLEPVRIEEASPQNRLAIIQIGQVVAANHSQSDTISFPDRYSQVQLVWQNLGRFEPGIAHLLEQHEQMVHSGQPLGTPGLELASAIQRGVAEAWTDYAMSGNTPSTDVLPALLEVLGQPSSQPVLSLAAIPPEELVIRRREVDRLRKRLAVRRDADSVRFRREIRQAYRSTCVVCGLRLPALGNYSNPGVDAAHILPWCEYDLDHVSNGVCLCKLHHWAFDEGLIEIQWTGTDYRVVVPEDAERRIVDSGVVFSLDFLREAVGMIPRDRLPLDQALWPSPTCLRRLREEPAEA